MHCELLVLPSVAVNVTTVSPMGKVLGASLVTVGLGSTASLADAPARKAAIAESEAGVPLASTACTVMPPGQVMAGAVVSSTVTVAVQVSLF